jgi:hypothetical protein
VSELNDSDVYEGDPSPEWAEVRRLWAALVVNEDGTVTNTADHGPGCVLCAEGRTSADHALGDS